uniref:FBA domain-containing protein n=1 Tax=Xiphophorus couchianus TaxID=32473 RepID=A0A3B5M6C6_9TELE
RKKKKKRKYIKLNQHVSPNSQPHGGSLPHPAAAFNIPLDILEEIFLNLPAHKVVCVCRLVCHHWKDVADNESLWRQRCRREGYNLHESSKVPSDWRFFYFMCKKRRNLIKNPRGEDEFKDWTIVRNGGDGWRVEKPIALHPNAEVQTNFVTSFRMCTKSQLIDLVNEGYSQAFMDEVQPHIKVSDWYAPRCNCEYNMSVKLLHSNKRIIEEFTPGTIHLPEQENRRWKQMIHVFKDYGPGVRYVYFEHGGKDSVFWAGWYGIRLTETSIELCPALDKQNY